MTDAPLDSLPEAPVEPMRDVLPDDVYGPAMTCAQPDLRRDGVPAKPGTLWTCTECGATWEVKGFANWGAVVNDVQWQTSAPPPPDWIPSPDDDPEETA